MSSTTKEPVAPSMFVPTPQYLFSAKVNLAKPLEPIPLLQGGHRLVEPITSGTISGPDFEATIEGGLAAPVLVDNAADASQSQLVLAYIYGHTSDGQAFFMEETGVGPRPTQTTRLAVNVGGKHAALQGMYIIAQLQINESRDLVTAVCFNVPLPPS